MFPFKNKKLIHEIESKRVVALRQLEVLDSPQEALFDSIVNLASEICDMPIALISLVDSDRQWFKAQTGLKNISETKREFSFCSHTINGNKLMEVNDATKDKRFLNNPLVTGEPNIVFYAGVSLALPKGEKIGSICVIDNKPNQLTTMQKTVLTRLADITTKALVARSLSLKEVRINLQIS